MYFPKYRLRKTWLDKCLKSRLSDDLWTENMENSSKQWSNLNESSFAKFINTGKVAAFKNVSFSDTENPQTVC